MARAAKPFTKSQTKPVATSQLAGYVRNTKDVLSRLIELKLVTIRLILISTLIILIIAGPTLYAHFTDTAASINDLATVSATGFAAFVIELFASLLSVVGGSVLSALSFAEQLGIAFAMFLTWVTTLWLLRAQAKGRENLNVREGLYTASAPLIPFVLVSLWGVLQILPLALVMSGFSLLSTAGGLSNILVRVAAIGIVILAVAYTLYWLVSTIMALIIVTIPGTYPWFALQSAKKIVSGFRLRIFKHVLWMVGFTVVTSTILLAPMLALDIITGHRLGLLVTLYGVMLYLAFVVFSTTYLYVQYRRIVDERAD